MDSPKKLFLLDAMALIYRSYFAFANNHRYNSKGLNTSTMFGFTNTLLELLNKEKPTHIAVVTDTAAPTERHTDFAAYKAHREEMPDDIRLALPWIEKIIKAFNIPHIGIDGFEADDVIGTMAKIAETKGFEVFMMTPDKDFGQLVTEHIHIYKPARMGNSAEVLGIAEVCKRYEISRPEQVIDILGLMGDSVDNIPGIPGVGEKTAIQLIKDFGSIENLLNNTDKLKGKLKERVEANKEMALLSRKLATIIIDVPVEFNEEELKLSPVNKEAVEEVFNELEFRNLLRRVIGESNGATQVDPNAQKDLFGNPVETKTKQEQFVEEELPAQYKTINEVEHNYFLADNEEKMRSLADTLLLQQEFCFDTETTGIDASDAELVGLSFSFKTHEAYYVPVSENREEVIKVLSVFKPVFENVSITKIGQNLKYDITILDNYGIKVNGPLFDTMLAHYLLQPDQRHNMDVMSENYLKYTPVSIENLIGKKGKAQLNMRQVPLNAIKEYAAEDADVTYQLKKTFYPLLNENNARHVFDTVEIPLIPVLASMEKEGAAINVDVLHEISKQLEEDLQLVEKEIIELAGTPFNLNSPKQLGDILFEVLKIDAKAKKTKTGQYATGEEVLAKLENKHPIVAKILEYREFQKLKSTYVDTLPDLINPKTKRIHTSYNQAVAATGRLSSNNPNLQNIPIRTERGREIRKAFVARNQDYTLLSADYSQIELRIIAELSKEQAMIEAFVNGEDIHTSTASKVWNVPLEEVTREMRSKAKTVNFGIIYGISAFGLSERVNISRTEAKEIIDQYFIKYPGIKNYMDNTILQAREKGYVETILGRRRYLKDINASNAVVRGYAERNAINAPIQGSAADMIKVAMINIYREMEERNLKSKMILQVHDELIFDCHISEKEELNALVKDLMRNSIKMQVPIEVETGFGNNWLEAH